MQQRATTHIHCGAQPLAFKSRTSTLDTTICCRVQGREAVAIGEATPRTLAGFKRAVQ
ncbi:hypothetical protein MNEG_14299, partial [Monoraphidium neglectum]